MKRLLLAAGLALACHGALFATGPGWLRGRWDQPPNLPRVVTLTLAYKQVSKAEPKPEEKTPKIQPKENSRAAKKKEGEVSREKPDLDPSPIKVQKPTKELPKPKEKQKSVNRSRQERKKITRPKPQRKKAPRPKQEHDQALQPKKEKPEESVPKSVPEPNPDARSRETQSSRTDEIFDALAAPEQDFIKGEETTEKPTEQIASVPPVRILEEAKPLYRKNPPPKYPRLARKRGYEGTVILEVLVDTKGRVGDLRIVESSGHKILDRAAWKSVKDWSFEPGKRGEEKVDMWVKIPLRFQIK